MTIQRNAIATGVTGLVFLLLSMALIIVGSRFRSTEANFWAGFIGFGILIQTFYLTLYFLLRTFTRPNTASLFSRITAAFAAVPLTIDTVALTSWLLQIDLAQDGSAQAVITLGILVFVTLGVPAFLLWRHAIGPRRKPRSEKQARTTQSRSS
jgi:hypothetical protein